MAVLRVLKLDVWESNLIPLLLAHPTVTSTRLSRFCRVYSQGHISQVLTILFQVCCVLASLIPITLIKTALPSSQKPAVTSPCSWYHGLDLNNGLQGASTRPGRLPRPRLQRLLGLHFLTPCYSSQLTIPQLPTHSPLKSR